MIISRVREHRTTNKHTGNLEVFFTSYVTYSLSNLVGLLYSTFSVFKKPQIKIEFYVLNVKDKF